MNEFKVITRMCLVIKLNTIYTRNVHFITYKTTLSLKAEMLTILCMITKTTIATIYSDSDICNLYHVTSKGNLHNTVKSVVLDTMSCTPLSI